MFNQVSAIEGTALSSLLAASSVTAGGCGVEDGSTEGAASLLILKRKLRVMRRHDIRNWNQAILAALRKRTILELSKLGVLQVLPDILAFHMRCTSVVTRAATTCVRSG